VARGPQFDSRALDPKRSGLVLPAIWAVKNGSYSNGFAEICDLERDCPRFISNLQHVLRVITIKDGRRLLMLPFIVPHFGDHAAIVIPNLRSHEESSIHQLN